MSNPFKLFQSLFPVPQTQVGVVQSIAGGVAVVRLQDGSYVQARGSASVSDNVFVKDGQLQGTAPSLSAVNIDI